MERPELVKRKVINDKTYSCKKLPFRKARPLQLRLAGAVAPILAEAASSGKKESEAEIGKRVLKALPGILPTLDYDLIIDLCETCMVDGQPVNVDAFDSDGTEDLQVAMLAMEMHFVNFIKGLQKDAGTLMAAAKGTKD